MSFWGNLRFFRILGANGHSGGHARLAAAWRALMLLQILWKPVDEVLTCTENAEEPRRKWNHPRLTMVKAVDPYNVRG